MANKLYLISRTDFGNLLKSALIEKYPDVVVHYSDGDRTIFTCPSVCDKVISVQRVSATYSSYYFDKLAVSFGDAWTTGTTITNPAPFCGNTRTSSAISGTQYIDKAQVVLGDSFIIINFECWRDQMMLIGKLTNGKFLCMGFNLESGYSNETHGYITDGRQSEVLIPTISEPFKDGLTHVLLPLIFTLNGNSILKNGDGSYATIPGLYNLPNINGAMGYQSLRVVYSTSYFVTRCRHFYNNKGQAMFHTPLFCEIDMA